MLHKSASELDKLITEEKRRVATEFFSEAWSNALAEGIEPSIIAESALFTALSRLTEAEGECSASHLVEALPAQFECGHFLPNRSLQ
ncbi:MAG: hypothetical protein COC23_02655 [Hyphomicrobiales bacterium]|nr:MAG: hypothetical protein COC23_02655 [Hyphomicrobiales bacterium]